MQGLEGEDRVLGPLGAKMGSGASTDNTSSINTGHLKSFQQCHFVISLWAVNNWDSDNSLGLLGSSKYERGK